MARNKGPTARQLRDACRVLALHIAAGAAADGVPEEEALSEFLDRLRDYAQDIGEQASWAVRIVYREARREARFRARGPIRTGVA